jgi:hypothetical protein
VSRAALRWAAGALWVSGCASGAPSISSASSSAAPACVGEVPSYRGAVAPLLEHYCFSCHSAGGDAAEDHDFSKYPVLHAQRRRLSAELEAGAMPPPDRPQPSRAERALLASWACWGAPDN